MAEQHSIISFEEMQSSQLEKEYVPVDEWGKGKEVLVQALSPKEIFVFRKTVEAHSDDDNFVNNALLSKAVINPGWTRKQWEVAEEKSPKPYLRILRRVQALCGMNQDEVEDAQKN